MFIPLHDGLPLRHVARPNATYALIGVNALVFAALTLGLLGNEGRLDTRFGFIPAVMFGSAVLGSDLIHIPTSMTLLTSLFIHGSFMHLAGNMLFLWVFGDNVEDAMGSLRFTLFYLLSGISGALLYAAFSPSSQAPLIGASGAVSGIVVAYLMLYPRVRVFGLVFNVLPLRIPAIWCVGAWILLQIGSAVLGAGGEIGWWAHVGGIAAGMIATPFFKRHEVKLFSQQIE